MLSSPQSEVRFVRMPDSVARLEDEDMLVSFNGGDKAGAWVSSLRMAVDEVINLSVVYVESTMWQTFSTL